MCLCRSSNSNLNRVRTVVIIITAVIICRSISLFYSRHDIKVTKLGVMVRDREPPSSVCCCITDECKIRSQTPAARSSITTKPKCRFQKNFPLIHAIKPQPGVILAMFIFARAYLTSALRWAQQGPRKLNICFHHSEVFPTFSWQRLPSGLHLASWLWWTSADNVGSCRTGW